MLRPMQRSRKSTNREVSAAERGGAERFWTILSIPADDDPSAGEYGLLDTQMLDETMAMREGLLEPAALIQNAAPLGDGGATARVMTRQGSAQATDDGARASDIQTAGYLEDAWDAVRDGFGASSDFGSNYVDMREANTIGADKYFHCKANCEAARRGGHGADVAAFLSDSREWIDQNIKGDPSQASGADQAANGYGRLRATAQPTVPCSAICASYRPTGLDPKY